MLRPAERAEWLQASLATLAISAAGVGLVFQVLAGLQGAYLTHVSGVWLALAADLSGSGVFYRDLVSELGYGGTRYFPLFFLVIAGLLEAGLPLAAAGLSAGVVSVAVLAAGAYRVARAAGAPVLTSGVFTAGAATSYFALQASFEIRADVLAAGLNLLGISMLLPVWSAAGAGGAARIWPAALVFLLAFTTKVTSFTIPLALIAAAVFTGRRQLAVKLALLMAVGAAAFLGLVQVASAGRAFRVWGAVMFGGSDSAGTLLSFMSGSYLSGLFRSHLVSAVLAVAVATLSAGVIFRRSAEPAGIPAVVPVAIWLGASATLVLTLSSPGTVPANQVIEWISVSLLIPAIVGGANPRVRRLGAAVVASVVIWMAVQNGVRWREQAVVRTEGHRAAERELVARVSAIDAPVLSESALWPLLAGREVVLPDPFALRVVLLGDREIESRLVAEIAAQRYRGIVLEFDPASPEGEAVYGFSHFSPRVIAMVRARYQRDTHQAGVGVIFVPRTEPRTVDTPRAY